MLESFDWLSFDHVAFEYIVHAFIAQVFTTCEDEGLETEAHTDFGHQLVVDFLAGVERNIQMAEFLS